MLASVLSRILGKQNCPPEMQTKLCMGIIKSWIGKINPSGNELLGISFQKARMAFWGEVQPGFGVHWCVYTNEHRSPGGLRDARKGIDIQ